MKLAFLNARHVVAIQILVMTTLNLAVPAPDFRRKADSTVAPLAAADNISPAFGSPRDDFR